MNNAVWLAITSAPDTHAAFRAVFEAPSAGEVEIRTVGSSWYRAWIDGEWLLEGPLRFAPERPEHDTHRVRLSPGLHVLAFHAHHIGAGTRILQNLPPFLWCRVLCDGKEIPLTWRATPLTGYRSGLRRINPQLGWMENCVTAENPMGWQQPDFDSSDWAPAKEIPSPEPLPANLGNVLRIETPMRLVGSGKLATSFGYPDDDPPTGFFLRDQSPTTLPATGTWHRYDLGRVRLGNPEFTISALPGTVLEIARSESLTQGRVSPWINLSLGQSCNLDRFVLAGGEQIIAPLTPRGGRFVEIHLTNSTEARILEARFHERTYYPPSDASFRCGDPLLELIWETGVETCRACTEDALMDNPTRERGQWINDVPTVHTAIAGATYNDLRLSRRALEQAALCAREDGLVAGMCPGGPEYLPTIALQWVAGVLSYYRLTGDTDLLIFLHPAAERNLAVFADRQPDGWNFIDWGYQCEEPVDLACSLHYLWALRSMVEWSRKIDRDEKLYVAKAEAVTRMIQERLNGDLGYHCTVLALTLGLVPNKAPAIEQVKRHLLACFPNDKSAPRNDQPFVSNSQVITPFFAHYAFPVLIEAGEMDFVLDQYRRCWGWMLEGGRTTWLEVFDTRWSHCHAWSGCPTWQLSRYLSGLHPRQDIGPEVLDWKFHPGSLKNAEIRLPHAGNWIDIRWQRLNNEIHYTLETPVPLQIRGLHATPTTVGRKLEAILKI